MNILIIGASGRTGSLVAAQAIARGHIVTALLRARPTNFASPSMRLVVGSPTSRVDVELALKNQDAVISCLGQRTTADAQLLRNSASVAIEAMRSSPARRYIAISQGLLFPTRSPLIRILRFFLARHVADSQAMEEAVTASQLDWTIVRAPRLLDGGGIHGYRVVENGRPTGSSSIQRGDLATYLVDAAELHLHASAIVGIAGA